MMTCNLFLFLYVNLSCAPADFSGRVRATTTKVSLQTSSEADRAFD